MVQLKDGRRYRRALLLVLGVLVVLVGCRQSGTTRTPAAHSPAAPAPLLVTIVVDQMAAWLADQRWPALDPSGGFSRLRREGTTVREMRYQHAVTDTAPGHAALFTGTTPRENGIVANEVIGPEGGSPHSILADDSTHLLGFDTDLSRRAGSSLGILQGETIADVFRASRPNGQVFSFSLKDRGALFGGGRHPDAVLWLDPESGAFVTSTAFATRAPAWLGAAGGRAAVAAAMTAGWSLSGDDRAWIATHAATRDDQRGEGDYGKLGTVFPHAIGSAKSLRATPAGDRLLFGLAAAALARAAANHQPTLLALSLSSYDYVAHVFGPDSWEAWDELRQLDRLLAAFLAALDAAVGPDGYAVMLTGDHGSSPLPELAGTPADPWCRPGASAGAGGSDHWERPCGPRRRLIAADLVATLESALAQTFGAGPWLAGSGIADPLIFLGARARSLDAANQRKLLAVVKQTLAPLGIADVVDVQRQRGPCPTPEDTRDQLICAATHPGQPGDLYMVVAPGAFFDPGYTPGFGSSHGSPYLYDRAVPLLVRAPGRVAAGRTVDGPLPFSTSTRTASALRGVRPPTGARAGQDLTALR